MASLAFNLSAVPFSCHSGKQTFPAVHKFPTIAAKSSVTVKCSSLTLTQSTTEFMRKLKEELKKRDAISISIRDTDTPSSLCIVDTLQRLGVDRYFQSEIDAILEDTYRLWQRKHKCIFSDITTHAMAFRLLRVHGYHVSSEELRPYADHEEVVRDVGVGVVVELYRAAQERIYEDETALHKLLAWTTSFLNHHLLSNSNLPHNKLHKLVEYYLNNYHGIMDRVGVRRSLDLYDIGYYPALQPVLDRFPSLSNEDLVAFARQDFNICQAQHHKELQQLQRWNEDCRLDTFTSGRDAVGAANFLTSAIMGDPEYSDVRLAFAKQIVLVARIDDFFDHVGPREESYKILELVKEWAEAEKGAGAEHGSEEVEILFTALYKTVNELAEMAHLQQGRSVKHLLIQLWVEIVSVFKLELETWNDINEAEAVSLDEYLCSSWVSVGCRVCILTSMQFLGIKISQEMVESDECSELCRHVSMVDRLLNDVGSFQRERSQNTVNSVSILVKKGLSEDEAVAMLKKMAENKRRKLMQLVYKKGTKIPRKCKDLFLKACRIGCYLYSSGDEFTYPRQMMEDMKSLVYQSPTAPDADSDAYASC